MNTLHQTALAIQSIIPGSTIDYIPDFKFDKLTGMKILIVPIGVQQVPITRGKREKIVSINIGIIKPIKETDLQSMLDKVEEITNTLFDTPLVNISAIVKEIVNEPAYNVDSMINEETFQSILHVSVRIL